jgi:hypothetical protein
LNDPRSVRRDSRRPGPLRDAARLPLRGSIQRARRALRRRWGSRCVRPAGPSHIGGAGAQAIAGSRGKWTTEKAWVVRHRPRLRTLGSGYSGAESRSQALASRLVGRRIHHPDVNALQEEPTLEPIGTTPRRFERRDTANAPRGDANATRLAEIAKRGRYGRWESALGGRGVPAPRCRRRFGSRTVRLADAKR